MNNSGFFEVIQHTRRRRNPYFYFRLGYCFCFKNLLYKIYLTEVLFLAIYLNQRLLSVSKSRAASSLRDLLLFHFVTLALILPHEFPNSNNLQSYTTV